MWLRGRDAESIGLPLFAAMLEAGLTGLQGIVEAQVGDKTLVDTLFPAMDTLKHGAEEAASFADTLKTMKTAAERGRDSHKGHGREIRTFQPFGRTL